MARFNTKKAVVGPDTVNVAGGEAFQESTELELVSLLLTSMVQDQFYRSAGQSLDRLTTLVDALVKGGKAYFVAQAGVYARREFGLRSITHALAALMARRVRGADWTKDFYNAIVKRPDDMLEIMAIVLATGKNVPNALKDGFARALIRMDEYNLAKYRGEGKAVKMVDVVNLVHPGDRHFDNLLNASPLRKLMSGTLAPANTWETGLSGAGQKSGNIKEKMKMKAEVWSDLLKNKKIGYLALLRNIRNIAETVTDEETIRIAVDAIQDRNAIKKSLIFPFQIHTAYDIIKVGSNGIRMGPNEKMVDPIVRRLFMKALAHAADLSLDNVPRFEGSTLIAMDLSGSMTGGAVGTSTAAKVGGLFAAALWKRNDGADLMEFGTSAIYTSMDMVQNPLFTIAEHLANAGLGGTNFNEIFRMARRKYDRIIIISDCQAWEEFNTPKKALDQYKILAGADPHIFSLDLCGLGTLQFPENRVYALAGFSNKVFDVMQMLENDRLAMINTIKKIDIHAEALKVGGKKGR